MSGSQTVDPKLLDVIRQVESGGLNTAVSSAGAQGAYQLMPATAQALGVNPNDPTQARQGAANLLAQNMARFHNPDQAVAAYFAGPNPANWGPKTQAYVEKVSKLYNAQPAQSAAVDPAEAALNASLQDAPAKATPAATPDATSSAPSNDPAEMALHASMQEPAAPPQPPTQDKIVAGIGRGLHTLTDAPAEALASGVGDAVHALGFGQDFHPGADTRAADQQASQNYQQNFSQYPIANAANVGTQVVGGAAMLGSGEGALGAITGGAKALADGSVLAPVANAAKGVADFVTGQGGSGLLSRGASLAAQGGTQMAGFDALTGRPITPQDVALGAVLSPAVAGVGKVIGGVASNIAGKALPASTQAAKVVSGALATDRVAPTDMAALGRNGNTLLEVGGANTRSLAESLANKPGEASETLSDALHSRINNAPQNVAQTVFSALGSKGDVYDLDEALATQQKAAAGPLYDKAYAVGHVMNDQLAGLLKRPAVASAWQRAQTIAANEGVELPKVFATDETGKITGVNTIPNMQTWDYIKRGLDDEVQAHVEPITGKITTDAARGVNTVRQQLLGALDEANPAYADARAAFAGPAQVRNAIQMGRKVFNQDSEITANQIAKMSPSEKQAYQAGVARAVLDKVDNTAPGQNVANKVMRTPLVQKKVAAAFDDPAAFENFAQLLDDVSSQAATKNAVMGNSATARRLAAAGHNFAGTLGHAAYETAVGSPMRAAMMVGRGVLDHVAKQGSPSVDAEIANLLTNPNRNAVVNQLSSAQPSVVGMAARNLLGGGAKAARLYTVPALMPQNP